MDLCAAVNGSKLAWGLSALCVNLGARYLMQDVTLAQQSVLANAAFKRVVVFCIVFLATRDLLLSTALAMVVIYVLDVGSAGSTTSSASSTVNQVENAQARAQAAASCLARGYCAGPQHHNASSFATTFAKPRVARQLYAQAVQGIQQLHSSSSSQSSSSGSDPATMISFFA